LPIPFGAGNPYNVTMISNAELSNAGLSNARL
jgi:hypothetical protein